MYDTYSCEAKPLHSLVELLYQKNNRFVCEIDIFGSTDLGTWDIDLNVVKYPSNISILNMTLYNGNCFSVNIFQ